MGSFISCGQGDQTTSLRVATLNFSGINLNPFEYHDGSQEYDQLNSLFVKNLQKIKPQLTNWKVGKIGKEIFNRMTVCYPEHFKLCQDGKLPNRAEFAKIWRETFPPKETLKIPPTEEEKEQCIVMDYLIYLTVLQYVYKTEQKGISIETLDATIKDYNSQHVLNYLNEKKDKPQCKLQVKTKKVLDYILKNNTDVLFLQEATSPHWAKSLAEGYEYVNKHDSFIIYKKQKIGNVQQNLQEKYTKQLDFNNDTVFFFSDKGYLLISAHLKSSKEHIIQAKEMFETFQKVLADHPKLKMIMGIDANHFIKSQDIPASLNLMKIPENEQVPTSLKKRTHLQPQALKSDKEICEVKDLILTNKKIESFLIETVEKKQIKKIENMKEYIPSPSHPYDHYFVTAQIV